MHHLDTNVAVDLIRGKFLRVDARFLAIDKRLVAVSVVVTGELRLGVEKTGNVSDSLALQAFLAPFQVVNVDQAVAVRYARLRADLERTGKKMESNDLWIAATALVRGATLVTADEAFGRVPGLSVENWRV